ncbi:hypothetical protein JCM10449v2_004882 [Rhodotorula kratochvilovae]
MPRAQPSPSIVRRAAFPLAVVAIFASSALAYKHVLEKRKVDQREHARRKDYPNPL